MLTRRNLLKSAVGLLAGLVPARRLLASKDSAQEAKRNLRTTLIGQRRRYVKVEGSIYQVKWDRPLMICTRNGIYITHPDGRIEKVEA